MLRVTAAVVIVGLVVSGLVLRVSSWTHAGTLSSAAYLDAYAIHGTVGFAMLSVTLVTLAPGAPPAPWVRPMLVLAVVGAALLVNLDGFGLGGWRVTPRVLVGDAVGITAMAVFAATVLAKRVGTPAGALFAVATLTLAAAWLAPILSPVLAAAAAYPLVAVVVAAPALESEEAPTRRRIVTATVVYLLARTGVRLAGIAPLALVELVAGLVLAHAVFAAATHAPSWRRTVLRIEAALFAQGVLGSAFLGVLAVDIHIHDTVFVTGFWHFEMFVLLYAFARALHEGSSPRVAWAALAVATVGAHVFGWGFVVLGARGMPRRYERYLPEFQSLHRLVSIGAAVFAIGAVAVVLTRSRPPRSGAESIRG